MTAIATSELRERWAALRPESLVMAARRLSADYHDITPRVMKHERSRHPDCFPKPIPIMGAELNKRLTLYSADEMDHWAANGRYVDSDDHSSYGLLRGRTLRVADEVGAVQLTLAATLMLPDVDDAVAIRRVRGWRENRDTNGFPDPLPVRADYTIATMVFCLPELMDWVGAYLSGAIATMTDEEKHAFYSARALRGARTREATQSEAM